MSILSSEGALSMRSSARRTIEEAERRRVRETEHMRGCAMDGEAPDSIFSCTRGRLSTLPSAAHMLLLSFRRPSIISGTTTSLWIVSRSRAVVGMVGVCCRRCHSAASGPENRLWESPLSPWARSYKVPAQAPGCGAPHLDHLLPSPRSRMPSSQLRSQRPGARAQSRARTPSEAPPRKKQRRAEVESSEEDNNLYNYDQYSRSDATSDLEPEPEPQPRKQTRKQQAQAAKKQISQDPETALESDRSSFGKLVRAMRAKTSSEREK